MGELRPVLRWAGSKRQVVHVLERYWSDKFDRYVEPFAGSASLFFRVNPSDALLADKNAELIEAYGVIRGRPRDLYRAVAAIARTEADYKRVRSLRPGGMTRFDRAVRFVYLNRNCFNGIYRTNKLGHFNVPFARSRAGELPTEDEFLAVAERLNRATLRAWDFGTTLRHCRGGDFVYLDPPYFIQDRRVFREYGPRSFSSRDIVRLATHLRKMDRRGVKFLLSYENSPDVSALKDAWNYSVLSVRRNVAGFAGQRRTASELVITNLDRHEY